MCGLLPSWQARHRWAMIGLMRASYSALSSPWCTQAMMAALSSAGSIPDIGPDSAASNLVAVRLPL